MPRSEHSSASEWPRSWGAYRSYGNSADLWGTTLTPADVNSSGFGVAYSGQVDGRDRPRPRPTTSTATTSG